MTGIIIIGILALIPISIVTTVTLSNMKLKVEQIRANAMVRAEEVKAKNQLEIEKLFYEQNANKALNMNFHNRGQDMYTQCDVERKIQERKNKEI